LLIGCKQIILHPPMLAITLKTEETKAYRPRTDGSLRDISPAAK
jgi:hypothetical protein